MATEGNALYGATISSFVAVKYYVESCFTLPPLSDLPQLGDLPRIDGVSNEKRPQKLSVDLVLGFKLAAEAWRQWRW